MINKYQQTIKKQVSFNGFGIHTGKFAEVFLHPLPENSGIVFRSESRAIKYAPENVRGDARGTQLIIDDQTTVMTVEHIVSAIAGMGVDNILVDIEGPEIPIKDGSPKYFINKIKEAGIVQQKTEKKLFKIQEKIFMSDGDKAILVLPSDSFSVSFLIDYNDRLVKTDIAKFDFSYDDYETEIGQARTYGFLHEVKNLFENHKALGATLANSIVVGEEGYSVPLNYPDELVRHKIADFIGDIMALGKFPLGAFYVLKSGHTLNQKFVQMVYAQHSA